MATIFVPTREEFSDDLEDELASLERELADLARSQLAPLVAKHRDVLRRWALALVGWQSADPRFLVADWPDRLMRHNPARVLHAIGDAAGLVEHPKERRA